VNLNNGITVDIAVPFGGLKQSGYGPGRHRTAAS